MLIAIILIVVAIPLLAEIIWLRAISTKRSGY
jgi:hypothetical protein